MIVEYAKNPVRKSSNTIELIVKFAEFDQELPFTSCSCDCEPYGREIYINAINGQYGKIEGDKE